MWVRFLEHGASRALTAGILYTLFVVLAEQGLALYARWARWQNKRWVWRLELWPHWRALARLIGLAFTVGFLFVLLLEGTFSSVDVGITPVAWQDHWPWLVTIIPLAAAAIGALWAWYWRTQKRPETHASRVTAHRPWLQIIGDAVHQEAGLAILRAASSPLLGTYWGTWAGLLWHMLLQRLSPGWNAQRYQPEQRGYVYLALALDWVSATLYIISGSVWAALGARAICSAVAELMRRAVSFQPEVAATPSPSPQYEGQHHQSGEHGSSQDTDTLQVP